MSLARFTHCWRDVQLIKSTLESHLADRKLKTHIACDPKFHF